MPSSNGGGPSRGGGGSGSGPSSSSSSHVVFSKVDDLVSKPVLGSDGAASWQSFQQKSKSTTGTKVSSVAPRAPLKKVDKLGTGMQSWKDELCREQELRRQSGHTAMNSGYTTFKRKQQNQNDDDDNDGDGDEGEGGNSKTNTNINRKQREMILGRKRPDDVEYFIKSTNFDGWKFDYVYTTRNTYGTGYYWDGMDSIKKLNNGNDGNSGNNGDGRNNPVPPTSSSSSNKKKRTMDEQEDEGRDGETNDKSNKKKSKKDKKDEKKKKKKKDKAKGPVIVSDPNNPLEQVHAMLQQRQLHHQYQQQQQYQYHPSHYQHQQQQQKLQQESQQIQIHNNNDLPDGWATAVDPTSQKTYYFHRQSGERRWDKPPSSSSSSSSTKNENEEQGEGDSGKDKDGSDNDDDNDNTLPDGWEIAKDPSTGKTYYFHRKGGKTSWEKPTQEAW